MAAGAQGCPVTEADIDTILALDNQIRRFQAMLACIAESVLARLRDGRPVEDGAHDAEYASVWRSGVLEEHLIIDGVVRYLRIAGEAAVLTRRLRQGA